MERFPGVALGFSDHTLGSTAAVGAAYLGATVVEKHLTFSRLMYGSDAKNGMEPHEFIAFSSALREAWAMRSSPTDKDLLARTILAEMRIVFQKSIVSAKNLYHDQVLRREDFCFKKPGDGLSPRILDSLIGRRLKRGVAEDHKFSLDDFQ
jgi:N-acetylneuraminate synthase